VADVSSDFAHLADDDIDEHVRTSLAHVGTVLEVAECALWTVDREKGPSLLARWRSEPGLPLPSMLDEALMAWAAPRLLRDEMVSLPDVSEVRQSALFHAGLRHADALLLPLRVDGQVMGSLSVLHAHARDWPMHVADGLRTVGEIIATAVARKRTEASMRRQLLTLAHVNRVAGLGELAASLAHQLNQPLAAMMSNAEAALELLERPDPPVAEIRDILADVIADNERAGGIIRHMRTMLRQQQVEPALVDVNVIVARVSDLVAHDARLRGSSLDISLGDGLPPVRVDSTQLKQVLLNLVVNATDAMAAVTSRQPVELRTVARDDGVLIEVRDHGQGISTEAVQRLFDPFFTTRPDGLGVGLSITRSIVEAAGGRISGQNVPAGGAVFRVWLPKAGGTAG
jgi:signal transduction histidine kinase